MDFLSLPTLIKEFREMLEQTLQNQKRIEKRLAANEKQLNHAMRAIQRSYEMLKEVTTHMNNNLEIATGDLSNMTLVKEGWGGAMEM